MSVLVHKAVEPDNLTRKGKARLEAMIQTGEFLVQPKLDGVYCQIVHTDDGWQAFSRTGELLPSVPAHIIGQFAGRDTRMRWMGELWVAGVPHSTINGMARKKSPQAGLELHLFDAIGPESGTLYVYRHEALAERGMWKRGVSVIQNLPVALPRVFETAMEQLYALAERTKAKESAYDGLILRDRYGIFKAGSGKDGGIIKVKPRQSGDFRVTACTEGIGNRAGGIGAYVVDLGGGVTCEVGTGLDMADVRGECLTGKIIEVEYLSITKDGRLREPVFKSVRWDKTAADVLECNVSGTD